MGARPFMLYLTFNLLIQYTIVLLTGQYDPIITQLNHSIVVAWYMGIAIGSAIVFTGATFLRKKYFGLVLQRVGVLLMGLLSTGQFFLIVSLVRVETITLVLGALSVATFAAACFKHAWDVSRYMRSVQIIASTEVEEG